MEGVLWEAQNLSMKQRTKMRSKMDPAKNIKGPKPCPSFPCFFFEFLVFFPLRGIPCFFERFSLLFQGFQGFGRDKDPCFFGVFPCLFPKKQGKEGQGSAKMNAPRISAKIGVPKLNAKVQCHWCLWYENFKKISAEPVQTPSLKNQIAIASNL